MSEKKENQRPMPEQETDAVAADAPAEQEAAGEELRTPEAIIEDLRAELKSANDQTLRAQADLENFRKRLYRQMDDERKYANLPLLRDLLTVIDNLERAIGSAGGDEGNSGLVEGVKMVAQQFRNVLEQHHCRRIEAKGRPFDPNLHEAIAQQPSADHPEGTVLEETLVGYQLHDRVVRPSQVLVSTVMPAESD